MRHSFAPSLVSIVVMVQCSNLYLQVAPKALWSVVATRFQFTIHRSWQSKCTFSNCRSVGGCES
ncbi:hypothetical protein KC19_12G097400 [Ceratodon purpureus]|uniref:Secreted protein n=1 Tax=Ceratodon purpureus TaxID=3225 RepID=A0A8T0G5H6_CERPU|nr:hypothetical protein KC19_12G097400 [Ceratodon purpureus]